MSPDLSPAAMKAALVAMLCEKSFQYSLTPKFKLVSGRTSRFYVNCKPTTLHPEGMFLAGNLVFNALSDLKVAAVGGMTFGADPIAVAAAFASYQRQHPIKAFSIRKTQKDHGIVKWIEGDLAAGDQVVVIDDVATTGGSTIKAIERARSEGLEVVRAIVLVDRQEGGVDAIRRHVPEVKTIVTRHELMAHLEVVESKAF